MAVKIHGQITMDGAMFKRGLHEAGAEASAFIKNFALGAIGVSSIEHAIDKTIESAKELVDTSRRLDVTVEQLQVMRQAAEENGVEFNAMTTALQRFNAVRENILQGGKGSAAQMAAMQRLGVSPADLRNKTAADNIMGAVSEKARTSNAADIANDLKQVFGRGGQEIFGVLKTDFGELEGKMKSMGAIMDATTANQLSKFKDEMELIGRIFESQLAPVLVLLGKGLFEVQAALGAFGTFLGYQMAVIVDAFKHPIETLKNPKKFFAEFGEGALDAGGDYWKEKQKQFDEIFNKKPEVIKPPSVNFEKSPEKQKRESRERNISSDALISVGNFLGYGGNEINSLARQQLAVSIESRDYLKTISEKKDSSSSEDSVEYPDT